MKRIFFIMSLIVCCHVGWAQPRAATTTTEVDIHSATKVTVDELNPGVRISPFLCDYEMIPTPPDNKVKAVYEEYDTGVTTKSIASNPGSWIKEYVKVVTSKMMRKYDADAILSATSEAKTVNGKLVIIVRGYPVKYVNFRKAEEKDKWMLDFEKTNVRIMDEGSGGTSTVRSYEYQQK